MAIPISLQRVLKSTCPKELQNAKLSEQVEYIHKLLKCDKKEYKDLQRLARTFKVLQEINGVSVVGQRRSVLSERFRSASALRSEADQPDQQESAAENSAGASEAALRAFKFRLFKGDVAKNASFDCSKNVVGPAASTFDDVDLESDADSKTIKQHQKGKKGSSGTNKQVKQIFVPPVEELRPSSTKILRPMSASKDRIRSVVPPKYQGLSEAFPVYLSIARAREERRQQNEKLLEIDALASKYAEEGGDYLDYHLYAELGLLPDGKETGNDDATQLLSVKKKRKESLPSDGVAAVSNNNNNNSSDDDASDLGEEFWASLDCIAKFEREAPDQISDDDDDSEDERMISEIMAEKPKSPKSIRVKGRRITTKSHPWLASS